MVLFDILLDVIIFEVITIVVREFVRFLLFDSAHSLSGWRCNRRRRMIRALWLFRLLNLSAEPRFLLLALLLQHLACDLKATLLVWFLWGSCSWGLILVCTRAKEVFWRARLLATAIFEFIFPNILLYTIWLMSRLLLLLDDLLLWRSGCGSRSIANEEILEELHHYRLVLGEGPGKTSTAGEVLLVCRWRTS